MVSSILLMNEFRVATLNLNGAREMRKRAMLYEFVRLKKIDVLLIQETHSDKRNETDWKTEWEGEIVLSSLNSMSGGVGILFARSFTPVSYEVHSKVEGRLIMVKAKFEKCNIVFINLYAPVNGQERAIVLNDLNDLLLNCNSEDFLCLGGDFNCTQDERDRNHVEPHKPSQRVMNNVVATHDLVDMWRQLHINERQYTWAHVRENCMSLARLDRLYCYKHHFNMVKKCQISPYH